MHCRKKTLAAAVLTLSTVAGTANTGFAEAPSTLTAAQAWQVPPVSPEFRARWAARMQQRLRLFFTSDSLDQLRHDITGPKKQLWQDFIASADAAARRKPHKYDANEGEQLYQRGVGDDMATLAFAYGVSKDNKYLDAAVVFAKASCAYPTWGIDSATKKPATFGLSYGHQLLGLAMLYDLAADDLDVATRELVHRTLVERGQSVYDAYLPTVHPFLQNHTWINSTGLLAAALATGPDNPNAIQWAAMATHILQTSNKMLSPDGASQEGVGYWQYGVTFLINLIELSRGLVTEDLFNTPFWHATAEYPLYMSIPRGSWTKPTNPSVGGTMPVDFADCPRYNWSGPDHILRLLAAHNRDGLAQGLADAVVRAGCRSAASWQTVLFADPSVPASPIDQGPTLHTFTNFGIVSARSSWADDASLVAAKCGPTMGVFAQTEFPGLIQQGDLGHTHGDAGQFAIFGDGEWQIRNAGYVPRRAEYHNILLVDGKGQIGQKPTYFSPFPLPPKMPTIKAESTPDVDFITADVTNAYDASLGVTQAMRHLMFVKPNVLIVVDDIALSQPRKLELLFHPENPPKKVSESTYASHGEHSTLRVELLTPDGVAFAASDQTIAGRHQNERGRTYPVLTASKQASQWRNVVAFSWAESGKQPATVTMTRNDSKAASFEINGRPISLPWETQSSR